MTADIQPSPPSFGDRLAVGAAKVARVLLRLLVVLLVGAGLGAAVYFGVPTLYRSYIEPVRWNSEQILQLEEQLAEARVQARSRDAEVSDRLAELEGQLAAQRETLAGLETGLEGLRAAVEELAERLAGFDRLGRRVQSLEGDAEKAAAQIAELEGALSGSDLPTQRLARQVHLIRSMELLNRARLWLIEGDLGRAGEEIAAARKILESVLQGAPQAEADTIRPVLERLDLALKDLAVSPVIAADDLEIAWRLLVAASDLPIAPED
ncbi:MAG TPA: hypothetical protein VJ123_06420 [Anaerolineales bacterium]|nr:hypothetical protein [Anaerolineales bacterium]